jgi:type VI secretion system protein ImpB
MAESTQHKLDRVRPPRVQITYDVEVGAAIKQVELPFVVGIMSDLAGKQSDTLPRLKDRKFVDLDKDNFNQVLGAIRPRLTMRVDSKLPGQENEKLNVELNFSSLDDFNPAAIVTQVEPLRKLFEARQRLVDLTAKLDGNDALDALLQEIVENTEGLNELKKLTGATTDGEES